ncbi:MAG: GDSL-type esterase/lipase family protein [Actinomycetota bacterium]
MRRHVAAVALLLACVACVGDRGPNEVPFLDGADPTVTPPATPGAVGPVLAIGDSIMVGADEHGHLGAILALDGWELETIAERGRSTRWAVDEIEDREERVPRFVVVVLGTNPGFSAFGFAEDVEELRAALIERGARRILWIPPHHPDPERYAEKLEVLAAADRAEGRMVVAPWGAVLDAHPEWVVGDGLHLTEDGYAALAAFIADWLARLL